jgi:general secretion pathway protein B
MERDLGKVPTLEVPYQSEPERTPRRWWPWVLAVALLANLSIMAAYAWEYVIPAGDEGATLSSAMNAIVHEAPVHEAPVHEAPVHEAPVPEAPPSSTTPAIPRLEVNQPEDPPLSVQETATGRGEDQTAESLDQATLATAFQLVPATTGDEPAEEDPQPPAALSSVLTLAAPTQASASTLEEGARSRPASRSLAQPSIDEAPPSAEPTPPAARQIARLEPSPAATPLPAEPHPLVPRRRPKDEAWSNRTAAAEKTQMAALAEPQASAPLPPVNVIQEVSEVPLVPPQEIPEEELTGESAPAQTAHAPTVLKKSLGEVGGNGATPRDADLPRYEQLSRELRAEMPQITLSAHVFDPDPTRRFARINKEKFREGDEVAQSLWLDAVTVQGIILSYDGTRFSMGGY